jgi:hypothetical protein
MTPADVVAALDLPRAARVDQRVAKKLLLENGAVTATDKRRINDGVEELTWIAALKPATIGVPAYRDERREYLEIAVLALTLRPDARADRIVELVHRAVPYPLLLIATGSDTLALSVAHKRHAENEAGRVVLDEAVVGADVPTVASSLEWLTAFRVAAQPRLHLLSLYQAWLEGVEALAAAHITGRCAPALDPGARRKALAAHARLTRDVTLLRTQAKRETQLPRRVDLNLEIKRLEAILAEAKKSL